MMIFGLKGFALPLRQPDEPPGGELGCSMRHVLIAGVSTRAAAESAARAGYRVTALDAFADLDQAPSVRALSLPRDFGVPFSAAAAARASRALDADVVVYGSGFENHPSAVRLLACGRELWGNSPDVLRRVRHPRLLADELRQRGFSTPNVHEGRSEPDLSIDWLMKPRASGGGHGIRPWRPGMRVSARHYLQQRVEGTPASVVFVAAGGRAVPLGVSRQLCGDWAFGARGHRYCGSILTTPASAQWPGGLVEAACALAAAVAQAFGLRGVNGIDFVARGAVPVAIEVNPRWCASMELVERAYGISVFAIHAAACAGKTLPAFDLHAPLPGPTAWGKAVVFARRDVVAGDTRPWLDDPDIRDVPRAGERIAAGRPVCTVLAKEVDHRACYEALVARAESVYARLAQWKRRHASRRPE
jgi:predicted ATP-grasp superfamily ATP-dependent carboligase